MRCPLCQVQVEWSGPIACMSVHVDQRWAKQQEEQTLGALGMRVVNMNGVHVKFRQMGSFYFLEEQALLRNITVVLLWVQFPVLICYWFCMLFLGMLSGIYSAVLHQEVNVAEGLKGFSARLLTYSSAFMNLRGKSDNLKSDGVSKKCVSERLSKICENLEDWTDQSRWVMVARSFEVPGGSAIRQKPPKEVRGSKNLLSQLLGMKNTTWTRTYSLLMKSNEAFQISTNA
eukprot:g10305.t1